MRKAIVTIVVGDEYRRLYEYVAPLNKKWAERWGWDFIVVDNIPDEFKAHYCKNGESLGLICMWYKLVIPSLVRDYDLVAFFDGDCAINPNAECLSKYEPSIPRGGFAGVQEVSFEERRLFPNWSLYHYDGLHEYGGAPRFPERHINSGLLLYRPDEVWERWLELLDIESDLNDEYRLNLFEVQDDKCFFLPSHWNIVWFYERVRRGWSKGHYSNKLMRKMNKLYLNVAERRMVNEVFKGASMVHFALEHHKMALVDGGL